MGRLRQDTTANLLGKATTTEEVEEVLIAYVSAKFGAGNGEAQVLRKLYLLTLYLRAIGLSKTVVRHYEAFTIVASCVKSHVGLSRSPVTKLGIEAANIGRRTGRPLLLFGGGGKKGATRSRSSSSAASSVADVGYAYETVVDREDVERVRRRAGEGNTRGIGLLSAPPVYDELPNYRSAVAA